MKEEYEESLVSLWDILNEDQRKQISLLDRSSSLILNHSNSLINGKNNFSLTKQFSLPVEDKVATKFNGNHFSM